MGAYVYLIVLVLNLENLFWFTDLKLASFWSKLGEYIYRNPVGSRFNCINEKSRKGMATERIESQKVGWHRATDIILYLQYSQLAHYVV
jgi:hypothetical protein